MGVHVDYSLQFEGEEEELLQKLTRIRHRVQTLPIDSTSDIIRVEPVLSYSILAMVDELKLPIPPIVEERLAPIREDEDLLGHSIYLDCMFGGRLTREQKENWLVPALPLTKRTKHWKPSDYPSWIREGHYEGFKFATEAHNRKPPKEPKFYGHTANGKMILLLFAQALMCAGYIMYIDPGEGCETVNLGLSTFTQKGPGFWLGSGFTKTQYAHDLQRAHTNVCRILDVVQEEGLLLMARDGAGYYEDRDWGRARSRIAGELLIAGVVSGSMGSLLKATGKVPEDAKIEVVEDNAGTAFDRLRDMGATLEEAAEGLAELRNRPSRDSGEN